MSIISDLEKIIKKYNKNLPIKLPVAKNSSKKDKPPKPPVKPKPKPPVSDSKAPEKKVSIPEADWSRVRVIAHRGFSGMAPENTLAAYQLAAENPDFDAIECDIRRTRDGIFVIQHDDSMMRIFGLDQNITEVDYDSIRYVQAVGGNGVGKYHESLVRPCRLEEYLYIVRKSDKRAVIELKDVYTQDLTDELYDFITAYGMNDRMDYISFHYQALLNISRSMKTYMQRHPGRTAVDPDIYLLSSDPRKPDPKINNSVPVFWALSHGFNLSLFHKKVTPDIVDMAHKAGKKVNLWTVNNYADAARYVAGMGVDCITTNGWTKGPSQTGSKTKLNCC